MQVTTETKADGNYSSELTVVTVGPGGLAGQDENKIRMLLVRQCAQQPCPGSSLRGFMMCCRQHCASSVGTACIHVIESRNDACSTT